MSRGSPIPVLSCSPSVEAISRPDTPALRAELATRINGVHPDQHNSTWLAYAHAAMIGHFSSLFRALISKTLAQFSTDLSIVSMAFNTTGPPTTPNPAPSPAPLMIPPPAPTSPIAPNAEPITPTDPVPAYSPPAPATSPPIPPYSPTPSGHFKLASPQPLEEILTDIEAEVVGEAVADILPQPGVIPEGDWHRNFEEPCYHFFKVIPDEHSQLHVAPFVSIDLDTPSPQLLMTNGKNCPVHSRSLHARPEETPHANYDRCQNFLFTDMQIHTPAVDWAVEQEGDITLEAEVRRHCNLTKTVREIATHLTVLRDHLHDTQADLMVSSHSLSRSNAYRQVRRQIVNRISPQSSPYSSRHISRMVAAVDSPWNWTYEGLNMQCAWCKREGHSEEWCAYLCKCMLCGGKGHIDEDCCKPHAFCSPEVECNVPLLHIHHAKTPCPSDIRLDEEL